MEKYETGRMEDEKAPENVSLTEYDSVAEARVRRKLDWNMMPLLFVLCKSLLIGSRWQHIS